MRKMLRKPIAAFGVLLFVITLVLIGCRKNLSNELRDGDSSDDLEMFAKRIGVDPSSIKDSGNFIIVGGDMLILKKDLLTTTTKRQVVATTSNSTPAWSGGPISPENRGDIKIYINDGGPVSWSLPTSVVDRYREAVRQAISNFNTLIPFTSIKMREVTDQAACDISVNFNLGGAKAGYARYPLNGKPGTEVNLNLAMADDFPTVASATRLTTHELGHAIGLFHTDEIPASSFTESWSWGFFYLKQIPGTPGVASASNPNPDPQSFILQSTYAGLEWTQTPANSTGIGFSDNDIKAIQYLYPLYEISGSLSSCNGGYYSINNLPAGATVSWTAFPAGIVSFIPSGVNTVYVSRNGDGHADISATLTINGYSFITHLPQKLPIGAAPALDIVGLDPSIPLYGGQHVTLHVNEHVSSYNWTVTGGTIVGSATGQYVTIKLDNCFPGQTTPNTLNVDVILGNSCGISLPYYESAIPGVVCNGGDPIDPGEIL